MSVEYGSETDRLINEAQTLADPSVYSRHCDRGTLNQRNIAMRHNLLLSTFVLLIAGGSRHCSAEIILIEDGQARTQIVADSRRATPAGAGILKDAADWLAASLKSASRADFAVVDQTDAKTAIIIALAEVWPEVAHSAGLNTAGNDDYAIVTRENEARVYVLGNSADAARYGIADLLRRWGFRWFAPSPRWHVRPQFRDLAVDLNVVASPQLIERRIWYAYGMSGDDLRPLMQNYQRWAVANRLTLRGLIRTGHSYGHIIGRNQEAFAENPDLSALKEDGSRDTTSVPNARKFCFSNPGLISLVATDRRRLLEENRKSNPASFMVSVDPSDGQGTCHCSSCRKLGTTTDRVFHLANETARRLRADDPRAWVGLYAYSSHRLPPTIDVEPNVYVQVALGFNRTQYSLPELVDRWSEKVNAIGLREYYGVEAWDWGLPGRARGGRVAYHRKWIPFYAKRHLNGINAETNANWGAQSLGLYVASQMLWNPKVDVDSHVDEYFTMLFGTAADQMRSFYRKLEAAPPLRPGTLLPLFNDLQLASDQTDNPAVQARLTDLKAYLIYVAKFRDFDSVRGRNTSRNDAYYTALQPLMNYAWRIRHRDMVHYYALARRLCNGLPLQDRRLEFYMANRDQEPIWKTGESLTDTEVETMFAQTVDSLTADGDPTVAFSRYFDRVHVPGEDAGASYIHATQQKPLAVSRFRNGVRGYLAAAGPQTARLGIAPATKPVTLTVYLRSAVIFEQVYRSKDGQVSRFHDVEIRLPRAFEYRVDISGDFELQVPEETPFLFEASVTHPAWVSYSGPHYFYVPKGTRELIVDASPRLSLIIPGSGRRDLSPADRVDGKSYIVVKVPRGSDGHVWHTTTQTRGSVTLLNTPPLFSLHRNTTFVPREISESEGLSTGQ